jgi:hypothetical protein
MREEFEKWADLHDLSGKQRLAALLAFELRQLDNDALKAENERLREILKPFAEYAKHYPGGEIQLEDFHRAEAAMKDFSTT